MLSLTKAEFYKCPIVSGLSRFNIQATFVHHTSLVSKYFENIKFANIDVSQNQLSSEFNRSIVVK